MNFITIAAQEIEFWYSNGDIELTDADTKEIKSNLSLGITSGTLTGNKDEAYNEPIGYWRTVESYLLGEHMFCQHGGDVDRCIVCNPKTGDPYEW